MSSDERSFIAKHDLANGDTKKIVPYDDYEAT